MTNMTTYSDATSGHVSQLNIGVIEGISFLLILMLIVMMYLMYRGRRSTVLRIFGAKFFTFGVLNPAGQLDWINRTSNDFKVFGKVILFKYKDGNYRINEDRLFWIGNVPHAIYKFNNPNPMNIMGIEDAEISVYDEDAKQNVIVKVSSQELKGALESKVVNELNKVGFNKIETIILIVMVLAIVMNIVVIYEVIQISNDYSTLIGQLNQILQHYTSTTTTVP